MNDVLKIGILWIIISTPMIYFFKPLLWRSTLVGTIGIALVMIGFVINEYQAYKFEKNLEV